MRLETGFFLREFFGAHDDVSKKKQRAGRVATRANQTARVMLPRARQVKPNGRERERDRKAKTERLARFLFYSRSTAREGRTPDSSGRLFHPAFLFTLAFYSLSSRVSRSPFSPRVPRLLLFFLRERSDWARWPVLGPSTFTFLCAPLSPPLVPLAASVRTARPLRRVPRVVCFQTHPNRKRASKKMSAKDCDR